MLSKLTRFSGRASAYARHRPPYPDAVIPILKRRANWTPHSRIADIGAGTGISSELFLRHGNTVWAVEPNADMRTEAEALTARFPLLHVVDGTAEQTHLPNASVNLVVAATAFHWFDIERSRHEFYRILRPNGRVALIWNLHPPQQTPFVDAFEKLSARFGTTYRHSWGRERHNISNAVAKLFLSKTRYTARYLDNTEHLDLSGLEGRLLSMSYVPRPGEDGFEPMMDELRELFQAFAVDGTVELKYQTAVFCGELP